MDSLYIIQNQHHHYLSKQGEWVDGHDSQLLYRTAHKDEAINLKVEHAVRSPDLRLTIVPVTTNDKGRIQLAAPPEQDPNIDSNDPQTFTASASTQTRDESASPEADADAPNNESDEQSERLQQIL